MAAKLDGARLVASDVASLGSNDPKSAQSVLFWLLGSVAGASWQTLVPTAVVVLVTLLLLMIGSRWLDALAAGPELASSLGVPVTGLRVPAAPPY